MIIPVYSSLLTYHFYQAVCTERPEAFLVQIPVRDDFTRFGFGLGLLVHRFFSLLTLPLVEPVRHPIAQRSACMAQGAVVLHVTKFEQACYYNLEILTPLGLEKKIAPRC